MPFEVILCVKGVQAKTSYAQALQTQAKGRGLHSLVLYSLGHIDIRQDHAAKDSVLGDLSLHSFMWYFLNMFRYLISCTLFYFVVHIYRSCLRLATHRCMNFCESLLLQTVGSYYLAPIIPGISLVFETTVNKHR